MEDQMETDVFLHSKCPDAETTWISKSKDSKLIDDIGEKTLGPDTPSPDKENIKPLIGIDTSLTSTPESHVFDPFASGPEELVLAPRKKPLEGSRPYVIRRLVFECDGSSGQDLDEDSEMLFMESMYYLVMDVVSTNCAKDDACRKQLFELDLPEGCKTPRSLPMLTGIADTCPGAPTKVPPRPRRFFAPSLCRKLFES